MTYFGVLLWHFVVNLCAQLTRDLLTVAKFIVLSVNVGFVYFQRLFSDEKTDKALTLSAEPLGRYGIWQRISDYIESAATKAHQAAVMKPASCSSTHDHELTRFYTAHNTNSTDRNKAIWIFDALAPYGWVAGLAFSNRCQLRTFRRGCSQTVPIGRIGSGVAGFKLFSGSGRIFGDICSEVLWCCSIEQRS